MAFGAALLGVLFLGCTLPPFDEELSLAMATAAKLEPVVRIGPIQAWHGDFEQTDSCFLPLKDNPADRRGYLLSAGDYYLRVRFLEGSSGTFQGELRLDGPAGDPNRKTYSAAPLKGGACLSLAVFDPVNPTSNSLFLLDPGAATNLVSSVVNLYGTLNPDFGSSLERVVGVHLSPSLDPALDLFSFFGVLSTAGRFGELAAEANPSQPGGLGTISVDPLRQDMALLSLPAPASGAFYFHRPAAANPSYLSWYQASSGTYRNFTWDDTLVVRELAGIGRRIDALLSSGELLSIDRGICHVYDAGGNRKFSFPMGSLHFCFERYEAGGAARLYFSLLYWIYGYHSGNDQLYIEIYSLPTADLDTLD